MGVKSTIFKQTRLDVFLIAKKRDFGFKISVVLEFSYVIKINFRI